jgi:N6-L-threonylcarbamoyladenine synthase
MRILGIETSCDETAVCLIEADGGFGARFTYKVLGDALLSQAALHAQYGGVFPNLAKREHARHLVPLLQKALEEAGVLQPATAPAAGVALVPLKQLLEREQELFSALVPFLLKYERPDIDCIAVTAGPGLEPALWVGINFAKALSTVWAVPLVAVNHMEGHIVMPMMEDGKIREFEFPLLSLLISGGHTELVVSKRFGQYERIGETRDDAAGEAFDKVARLLELGYPGGPGISLLAKEAREKNVKGDFSFTRPMLHEDNYDFSFSGLKTAARNVVKEHELTDELKLQVAREFEECVAETLIAKTMRAVDEHGINTVLVGGGVSANTYIRYELSKKLATISCQLLLPPPALATDNALMIALAGYFHAQRQEFADPAALSASGNLRL